MTTRMAAAKISTSFRMAQFIRLRGLRNGGKRPGNFDDAYCERRVRVYCPRHAALSRAHRPSARRASSSCRTASAASTTSCTCISSSRVRSSSARASAVSLLYLLLVPLGPLGACLGCDRRL